MHMLYLLENSAILYIILATFTIFRYIHLILLFIYLIWPHFVSWFGYIEKYVHNLLLVYHILATFNLQCPLFFSLWHIYDNFAFLIFAWTGILIKP